MQFNSIRFKTSILYSAILAVILIIFSFVVYFNFHHVLYHNLDEELKVKAGEIVSILHAYEEVENLEDHPLGHVLDLLRKGQSGAINERTIIDDLWRKEFRLLDLKNDYINVMNVNGASLFTSNNFTEGLASLSRKQFPFSLEKTAYKNLISSKIKLRIINIPV